MNDIFLIDRELEQKLQLVQQGKITHAEYNSYCMAAIRRAFLPYYAGSDTVKEEK